jgi:hypothetical protein
MKRNSETACPHLRQGFAINSGPSAAPPSLWQEIKQ